METCFNYCGEKGYMSSDERKWIGRIRRLKEQHPDEVRIITEPEDNDGYIYAELPKEWLQVRPPKKMNYTDEQRQILSDRMKQMPRRGRKHERSIEK